MGGRHYTRQLALQALYALDANPLLGLSESIDAVKSSADGEFSKADKKRLKILVEGCQTSLETIDPLIESVSKNWKMARMDRVDRSILRLGSFELGLDENVPAPVVLSEMVELAKEFGSPESPAFVNGILDKVAHKVRPDEVKG